MKNMGLKHLVIAGGGPTQDLDQIRPMATHAGDIYDRRRETASLSEAVADCGRVVGTTARRGLYREHAKSPRELASELLQAASDRPVALVFGPEDDGLSNEDLLHCTHLLRIPTSPEFPSLNLAQAVLICAYELFVASGVYEPPVERSPEAPMEVKERFFQMWRTMLLEIGFMDEPKADHMMLGFIRAFSRGPLTLADLRMLMGVVRQTRWVVAQWRKYRALAIEAGLVKETDRRAPPLIPDIDTT